MLPLWLFIPLSLLIAFGSSLGYAQTEAKRPSGRVMSFTLIDTDTNEPITGYDPISSGATLNLAQLPSRNLTILANTEPGTVGSVRFALNGDGDFRTENLSPYALASKTAGGYAAWTPDPGSYSLTATPYSDLDAQGSVGTSFTIAFTVVDTVTDTVTDEVQAEGLTVNAGEDQTITLVETASLSGRVSAKGNDGGLRVSWNMLEGPGAVLFSNSSAAETTVDFALPGSYVLQLTATNGELSASSSLTVTVQSELSASRIADLESGALPLRGDPNFSESQLPAEARTWYRRMWAFINNRNQNTDYRSMASSGDLNTYARQLNAYHSNLLAIFRSTGDLRILDEVARNAQSMYDTLRDTDRDGYRNWQFKGQNADRPMLEEPMAHGHIAALVYALNANRGLSSPSGIDYGRLADNLLGYLRNDFEPKWRERSAQRIEWQGSEFPYLRATNHHAYVNLMRYHDYMYKLTGERGYRDYLDTMSNVIRRDVRDISTPIGTALVWGGRLSSDPFNSLNEGDELTLQPTIYANPSYAAMLDLHLEGVAPFDRSFMEKLARTLSHFILDGACTRNCSGSSGQLRIDVGGERDRRANNGSVYKTGSAQQRGFGRMAYNHYGNSNFPPYAAFDTTRDQKLTQVNLAAFQAIENWGTEQPRRGFIPMGMVFALLQR